MQGLMITSSVELPLWLFVVLAVLAFVAAADRILIPSVRWFIRQRLNRAIDEFSTHLKVSLRPFHLTKRQVLLDRLVYDPQVIDAMQAYAGEHEVPHEIAQAKVVEFAHEIVPAFNAYFYFRFGYWVSKKFARLLYRVKVGFLDPERLETVDPDATVVFVMNHRSNMDYILVSYLVNRESTVSYAAGEWARIWPLQTLVKAMGAFFVRRNSGDPLYRKVLERYVYMATKEGVCQAVFVEGGLSHDGRLRPPRLGFLDYILRNFHRNATRDIVFVPVGINYDRVLEDRSLLRRVKTDVEKRSSWFIIKTVVGFYRKNMALSPRERRIRFGYAGVNFGRPLSMRGYTTEQDINFSEMDRPERFREVERLAMELEDRIKHVIPVLPVPLVAMVMKEAGGDPLSLVEIKARVHHYFEGLQKRGAPLKDDEKPRERTITRAIDMLRHRGIIAHADGEYSRVDGEEEILDFYANSIAHWHSEEAPAPPPRTADPLTSPQPTR